MKKLPKAIAARIIDAIAALGIDPRPPGSIQLAGGDGERRIRVGDYRVIYDVSDHDAAMAPRPGPPRAGVDVLARTLADELPHLDLEPPSRSQPGRQARNVSI